MQLSSEKRNPLHMPMMNYYKEAIAELKIYLDSVKTDTTGHQYDA
jgi:hypothetical protein